MKIFNVDYGIRSMELEIDGEIYHIHFYKKKWGIDVVHIFMKEGNSFIPCVYKQKNIINYSIKSIINDIFLGIKRYFYSV